MALKSLFATLPVVVLAGTAWAEPATPEGAADLSAMFRVYLGATEGVVTVSPQGDSYGVVIDAAPLISLAPEAMAAQVSPIELTLTDNGDGTWDVVQDQPLSLEVHMPGALDLVVDVARYTSHGVFDESLNSFSSSSADLTGLTVKETVVQPGDDAMDVTYALDSMHFESAARPGLAGGVDTKSRYTMTGLTETMILPPMGDGMPPIEIGITVEDYAVDGSVEGFLPEAVYGLIAWAVAHPSEEAMMADKAGLKALLQAGIPLFAHLGATGTANNVKVTSPFGPISVGTLGFTVEANGVVADGLFREAFTLADLTLPEGLVPDWALPLLPKDVALDVAVSEFDLLGPADIALGLLQLADGVEPDPMLDQMLVSALMPSGVVNITLAPGGVSNDSYALSVEGQMSAGPEVMPTGKALVTVTGFEAVMAALNAAPADIKSQYIPMAGMAQGMATPGADGALVWEIDASTPGSLLVNGVNMMGGQ